MRPRTALIIGVTGQDGAYLAQFLLGKGYAVHGTSRSVPMARLDGLLTLGIRHDVTLHSVSPTDFGSVVRVVKRVGPSEIYNLSGQSSVALSYSQPAATFESIVTATLTILEATLHVAPAIRLYNAGSSECFGDTDTIGANEATAFRPKSPYGVAKAAAISLVANYREAYGLHACSGLMFNHESPLRPDHFVTRKIAAAAAGIARNSGERLLLGNFSIRRDWGWAPEYVEAMWAMLQRENPEDLVIASGASHTLEEFVAAAFREVGLDWRSHVDYDPALLRPSDIAYSQGNPEKARRTLGWRPRVGFAEIVAQMVQAERQLARMIS